MPRMTTSQHVLSVIILGTGTSYAVGDTFSMGASDVTLYAQWAGAWDGGSEARSGLHVATRGRPRCRSESGVAEVASWPGARAIVSHVPNRGGGLHVRRRSIR